MNINFKSYFKLVIFLSLIVVPTTFTAQNNILSGLLFSDQYNSTFNISEKERFVVEDSIKLSFDISFDTKKYYGNILFLGNNDNFYINLSTINYRNEDSSYIQLFINQNESTISFAELKEEIDLHKWSRFELKLNLELETIEITYKDVTKKIKVDLPKHLEVEIIFGKVPAWKYLIGLDACYYAVKNIEIIIDKEKKHLWSLNEVEGDYAYDEIGYRRGKQKSCEWLKSYHTNWREIARFNSDYIPGIAFNKSKSEIYVVNQEYIIKYNLITGDTKKINYNRKRPRTANTAIYNDFTQKLLSYYHGGGQISEFDENSKTWSSIDISKDTLQQYYSHTNFVDPRNGDVYILSGYGWYTTKNDLQRYNFRGKRWDKIETSGDIFTPRSNPLIALGEKEGEFYVFGGTGNKSGKQEEGFKPIKDLYLLNLNHNTYTKLWEIEDNSLALAITQRSGNLIPNYKEGVLYTILIDDHLQVHLPASAKLFEISIDSAYVNGLSNQISDQERIFNMHLFSDELSNNFILAANKVNDTSKVNGEAIIFRLKYPPLDAKEVIKKQKEKELRYAKSIEDNSFFLYIIILISAGIIFYFLLKYRKPKENNGLNQRKAQDAFSSIMFDSNSSDNNLINIFGGLLLIDKDGKDITSLLNPKIRELFLFILLKTYTNNGSHRINTNLITKNLWPDSMPGEAKNVRGVSTHNLREVIKNFDKIELIYEGKSWQLEISPNLRIDYLEYLKISSKIKESNLSIDEIKYFINTVKKGGLLPAISYKWLDGIKYEINERIINDAKKIIDNIKKSQIVVELADLILSIDSVYEYALYHKIKALHSLGHLGEMKATYDHFCEEYKYLYDEDYSNTLNYIIKKENI